ncbi:MAG: substrate-binding domain-containing protein [Spirochaetales bacterium]|nr:substrate-binding domain-containing protein [Spirochaetales bacterium]
MKKKRPTIGLLMDWAGRSYQVKIWTGISDYAKEKDANIISFVTGTVIPGKRDHTRFYRLINNENIDGLIVLSGSFINYIGLAQLKKILDLVKGVPFVSLTQKIDGIPSILINNQCAMAEIMEHLIVHHAYKKIAFIGGPEGSQESLERFQVYRDSLKKHDLVYEDDYYVRGDFEILGGQRAVKILLDDRKLDFDAIVAANDGMAIGAISALKERNIKVPEEMAVVGYDDIELLKAITPSVTSVQQPLYEQGRLAAQVLLDVIANNRVNDEYVLNTKTIIRESCGCSLCDMKSGPGQGVDNYGLPLKEGYRLKVAKRDVFSRIEMSLLPGLSDCTHYQQKLSLKRLEQLIDALFLDIKKPGQDCFIYLWNDLLSESIQTDLDLGQWVLVLNLLHQDIDFWGLNDFDKKRIVKYLAKAKKEVIDIQKQLRKFGTMNSLWENLTVRELGEELTVTVDLPELVDLLEQTLPEFGIRSSYLSLYGGEERGDEASRLIVAFDEKGRFNLPESGFPYPSHLLVPQGFLPEDRQYSFVVDTLFHSNDQLGFVLFELSPKQGMVYEMLRRRMRNAVKGALLIQKIQIQTAELAKANQKLQQEIEQRRKIEASLRESESRMAAMIEANPIPLAIYRISDGSILYGNKYFFNTFGITAEEQNHKQIHQYFLNQQDLVTLNKKMRKGDVYIEDFEVCVKKEDGTPFWVVISQEKLFFQDQASIIVGFYDITERRRLEQEILEIDGRVQQRIGQDLHDGLGQYLTGISLMARVLEEELKQEKSPHGETAAEIKQLISESISIARNLSRGLFPVELDEGGLVSALQGLVLRTENQYNIKCEFKHKTDTELENKATALHLYRIAQEAIHNAVKHADPGSITVDLKEREGRLTLSIVDNGRGLPRETPRGKGMGLRIMQYRANIIEADFKIRKNNPHGTKVICSYDIKKSRGNLM